MHIAIDDTIPENVAKAWDIIKDILIEQRIATSKVIKPGITFANDVTQCGKQITIYQFCNPDRNWAAIINDIESRFVTAGIQPAQFSPTDKPITGSKYITYRNDLSEDRQHPIMAKSVMQYPLDRRYNPFGSPDIFVKISIETTPPSQTFVPTAFGGF